MQDGEAVAEPGAEARHRLWGEADLGDEDDRPPPPLQRRLDRRQVDLGLARAGDAVQQQSALGLRPAVERRDDLLDRAALLVEQRRRSRRGGADLAVLQRRPGAALAHAWVRRQGQAQSRARGSSSTRVRPRGRAAPAPPAPRSRAPRAARRAAPAAARSARRARRRRRAGAGARRARADPADLDVGHLLRQAVVEGPAQGAGGCQRLDLGDRHLTKVWRDADGRASWPRRRQPQSRRAGDLSGPPVLAGDPRLLPERRADRGGPRRHRQALRPAPPRSS